MATSLTLGGGVGGVGKGSISLIGTLLLGEATDSGEALNYALANANSPCQVEEKDLTSLETSIAIPSKAAGVVIMPSVDADFNAVLRLKALEYVSVTATAANDQITWTSHGLAVNDPVVFSGSAAPGGLTFGLVYYVKTVVDANNFTVSATPGGTVIDITSTGTSVTASWAGVEQSKTAPALLSFNNPPPSRFYLIWPGRKKLDVSVTADAGTNKINLTAHGLSNGDRVKFRASSNGSVPGGLAEGTLYYVVGAAANDFQVSTTSGGSAIDITTTGTNVLLSTVDKFKLFWF